MKSDGQLLVCHRGELLALIAAPRGQECTIKSNQMSRGFAKSSTRCCREKENEKILNRKKVQV
jgi:hypothetical protein